MGAHSPLGTDAELSVGGRRVRIHRPDRLPGVDPARYARQPRTVRLLLENLVRHFDPATGDESAIRALANGSTAADDLEFAFYPERVLLQDFTGVPVLVDLAMLRDAATRRGLAPQRINPVVPVDLIVDHSVQVDSFGSPRSIGINLDREYARNEERYGFLRWAATAFERMRIVPPGNGICHQVNLEHLATVVTEVAGPSGPEAFPDTVIGTDSHTTMVNGVSVLGWGVGGIEAEAVMLGEPYFLARPRVVGVELTGALPSGATATDLVLTVTRRLREKGVVDRFVEFVGPGVGSLSVPDRATVSNMCPEYGATAALFPIDEATTAYLAATARPPELVERVEAYARAQGWWGTPDPASLDFEDRVRIDLAAVVPSVSGPRNPEESVPLSQVAGSFRAARDRYRTTHPRRTRGRASGPPGTSPSVDDGAVVIAAITSCTNTSNPSVMIGAGLLARRALERGLRVPAHVKTSMAPGSKVVTAYLDRAGLLQPLAQLGFNVVGYGCTTCIGNSGPLPEAVDRQVRDDELFVAAVLSGNRNFEARIHNLVRANYLASPMLVVAYALAGRVDIDLSGAPVGHGVDGAEVYLKDLWPSAGEVAALVGSSLSPELFREKYRSITVGDAHWEGLSVPSGLGYRWDRGSTYLAEPPYLSLPPPWLPRDGKLATDARVLARLGDRVSTDHISPAGEIPPGTPAGEYLAAHGVPPDQLNTYGSRRGHHEVMVRGTFANLRLRNALAGDREGGYTAHLPTGEVLTIFEAAERYRRAHVPLLVVAGKGYGQGSSRDWAAKGPRLLGVGAVIAESYERIHRTNLVEMGVLPLEFLPGRSGEALGLSGRERYSLRLAGGTRLTPRCSIEVTATDERDHSVAFPVVARLHSETEVAYYRSGGVLPYVMDRRFSK